MIDLETIEREISELEARQPSYKLCERLSWLYIVRENILAKQYPTREDATMAVGGSEFLDAANGKSYRDVLKVLDGHMETIKMMYPKTYETLVDRIRRLR